MAFTYLQVKQSTAGRSGRTDGSTANTIRDNAINDVVRSTIANAYPFSWLKRTTTLTTDSSGDIDLPANFNPSHKLQPGFIFSANSDLVEINHELFDDYDQGGQNFFYITYNTSTSLYQLKTTEVSTGLTVTYSHTPAIMTANADVCVVPDQDCVTYLASAKVWLAKERDETNHDRDNLLGMQRLDRLILNDKRANPVRLIRSSIHTKDLGFNT